MTMKTNKKSVQFLRVTRKKMNELIKACAGTNKVIKLSYYAADMSNAAAPAAKKYFTAADIALSKLTMAEWADPKARKKAVLEAFNEAVASTVKTGLYIVADGPKATQMAKELNYTMFVVADDNLDLTQKPLQIPAESIRGFSCNNVIKAVIDNVTYTI
jgi:hypothetical protein